MDVFSLEEHCPYINPKDSKRCKKINSTPQEAARHWKSCHINKEAKAMLMGYLAVSQDTAIMSEVQLDEVRQWIQCPHCDALITRSDAMWHQMRTNCKGDAN